MVISRETLYNSCRYVCFCHVVVKSLMCFVRFSVKIVSKITYLISSKINFLLLNFEGVLMYRYLFSLCVSNGSAGPLKTMVAEHYFTARWSRLVFLQSLPHQHFLSSPVFYLVGVIVVLS